MTNLTKQVLISVAICKYAQIDLKEGKSLEEAACNCINNIGDEREIENTALTKTPKQSAIIPTRANLVKSLI